MPDHKIYIYTDGGIQATGSGSDAFKPFSNKEKKDESSADSVLGVINGAQGMMTSGFQPLISGGIAAFTKVFPYVAVAVAAVHITDKVVTTGANHLEEYKGDYRHDMFWNNLKTGLGNSINPIGLFLNQQHKNAQFQKRNAEIQMQRTLIGNTIVNDGKIGV